jgi:heat shock protein HslJ
MKNKWTVAIALLALASVAVAACGPVGGPASKTIYVGPYLVDCEGVAPQKCMLVKERPDDEWSLFYDQIEGFDYEPGHEYELRIAEEKVENPPADASSIRWTLVEVLSKTRTLEGTTWVLEAYLNSEGTLASVLPDSEVTATFEDGNVAGNAGCNGYFGSYRFHGGTKLTVTVMGMTEMYCAPDALMTQEADYLAALDKTASYIIAEDRLQIENIGGDEILVYSALGSAPSAPLVDTRWLLTGYNNGQGGFASVLAGTEVTASFGKDGNLDGSAGCNNYNSSYQVEDPSASSGAMSVGMVASTMMMCPEPGIMEQETAYLAALQSAAAYEIQGDQLAIVGADGTRLLTYEASVPLSLTGTVWQAMSYNNGKEAVVSLVIGTEITAIFGQDGALSGSAGCNDYNASYAAEAAPSGAEGTISIGQAATTRKFCAEPEGTMEQESLYLAALQMAEVYRIDGDRLQLRTSGGSLVADYVAQAQATGSDENPLANMEYKSEWTQSGTAPLVDGEYREPAAPGSATETVVTLTEQVAYGELNGQDAAAVVLVTDPGGSGTFYDLAIVMEEGGQPVNVATTSLGDRVQIQALTIVGNEIVVEMVNQGPDDPMCCPTQQVVQTYALEGNELVQTSSRVIGSTGAEEGGVAGGLVGVVWKWEKFLESNDDTLDVDDPERYTLEFMPDGVVRVRADCNSGSGSYTVNGNQLTIEIQALTMAMCPPGSLSDQYLKLLGDVVSYVPDGGKLALALKMDAGIMTFIK